MEQLHYLFHCHRINCELINYPNPFSSTRFVFTLMHEITSQMFIQIMTINGKVVKEITQDELGP